MHRSFPLLLTCVLALTTGIALLSAGAMVAVPSRESDSPSVPYAAAEANASLVGRFYDAVNTTVRTGDPASLTALVTADFADRADHPGFPPTLAGLVEHVLTLRVTFPAMWLAVEDLHAEGDWVVARVRVEGIARGAFLGVPFSSEPATWVGLDVYRIAGDRIAERWTTGDWPVLPHPLIQVPLPESPAAAVLRLARFTFAPGARLPEAGSLGPLLVTVESGALTIRGDKPAVLTRGDGGATSDPRSTAVAPGAEVELRPGDGFLLPSGIGNVFRNAGQTPAVALALTLLPWSVGAPDGNSFRWPVVAPPDITAHLLAGGVVRDLPTGPATIALGRLTLAPLAEFSAAGPLTPQLAVVEAGTLQLATLAGPATTLSTAQGTLIPPASAPTFRNAGDGPLVVLLLSIKSATPRSPLAGTPGSDTLAGVSKVRVPVHRDDLPPTG